MPEVSTKPYLLRAIYEWCTDNGYTPHIAVVVDAGTRVPMQFVKNGEIVLNISFEATSGLKMDNELIRFSARFGGVSRDISVPVENVIAIYARENSAFFWWIWLIIRWRFFCLFGFFHRYRY